MAPASVGRVVHALVDPVINNGSDVAPAVITRCWGSPSPDFHTVNYRLLLDALPSDREWRTSARLFEDRPAAEEFIDRQAEATQESYVGGKDAAVAFYRKSGAVAFWPPRVV